MQRRASHRLNARLGDPEDAKHECSPDTVGCRARGLVESVAAAPWIRTLGDGLDPTHVPRFPFWRGTRTANDPAARRDPDGRSPRQRGWARLNARRDFVDSDEFHH